MKYCSVNGQQQTEIEITERGLAYGDGLFTTAKIINHKVVLLDKHLERLFLGCHKLKLTLPDKSHLSEELNSIAINYSKAVLKVMITAGSGGRGYSRVGLTDTSTNVIIMVSDFPHHYDGLAQKGIELGDSQQHISTSPMLGGIKHLNRLEQVLLRAELDERSEDDLIVTNCQGHVVETTSANVFYWVNGQLCTPEIKTSGVDGIIRQMIIAHNPQVNVCQIKLVDLKYAEAMCICNSLMGIIPVKKYNNRVLDMNVVFKLQQQMNEFI